jgi:predicted Zn-dependent peptidase
MTNAPREIRRDVLPNGLVVITELMPHVRSVSVGVWVRSGARRELPHQTGMAHFIEHMVFKGTERRSVEEIARSVDALGGMLDAFTSKELICFSAKVLDAHLPIAFDVLSDLVLRPRFAEEDIKKEKSVILEEMKMDEDNPEYLLHDLFTQKFWPDHPLGKPIVGTRDIVSGFTRAALLDCYRAWFRPNNLVVTAAGNLEHARLVELATAAFGERPASLDGYVETPPRAQPQITLRHKADLEQAHILLGVPSLPVAHERRFAVYLLNNMLGGGMASRLFQNIRERLGLAYAVFSEVSPFRDTGLFSVYAGTAMETAERVVGLVAEEFRNLKAQPAGAEELRRAKDQFKGSLVLLLESTTSRMNNLARQEIYFARFFTLDEILAAIDVVTAEEVQAVAQELFRPEQIAVTVLGNLDGFDLNRDLLAC